MISLKVSHLHKRFSKEWILEDLNHHFLPQSKTGISGRNGSGKSTFLRMLAGFLSPSKGEIQYISKDQVIAQEKWYQHFAFFGPYIQLNEELHAAELFDFVSGVSNLSIHDSKSFLEIVELKKHRNKPIKSYSSGMKQRLAIGLTLISNKEMLFLDEPSSYLDTQAKEWLHNNLERFCSDKTVIIASNESSDFKMCSNFIEI